MSPSSFIIRIYKRNSFTIMQFFYVDSNDYSKDQDGLFQMCYDEICIDNPALEDVLTTEQIQVLADEMRERFKDYMRPLFS